MPARSNPFQKLVHHIQTQLSIGHSVAESAMLRHRLTGEDREVDVVIRSIVGEHPVVVSIECVDQDRPADVRWVEQMKAKHEHLQTDRLFLVSRSGFSNQALALAGSLGVATYTPEGALGQDWMRLVGQEKIFLSRFDFKPVATWIRIQEAGAPRLVEAGGDTRLRRPDNGTEGTLTEVVMYVLRDRTFAVPAMDGLTIDGGSEIEFDFDLAHQLVAIDTTGREHAVLGFRAKVRGVRRTASIPLQSLDWRGTPAAFGRGETGIGDTVVTFVEREPGALDARVIADGRSLEVVIHPDQRTTNDAG